MRRIARWLLDSPWWFWVAGWALSVLLHGLAVDEWNDALAVATWVPFVIFTAALPLLVVRFVVRPRRRPRSRRRAGAVVAALLLTAFIVQRLLAPGSTVGDAADAAMTSTDPSYCSDDVTARFLEQQNNAPAPFADDLCEERADYQRADSVDVSDIQVHGDQATAIVTVVGGSYDGFALGFEFVKDSGDWKADRIARFVTFSRPVFERNYRRKFAAFGSPPAAADCAIEHARRFTDDELQRIILSDSPGPWGLIDVECDREGVERSVLGAYNEDADLPARVSSCIDARIGSLNAAGLARTSADPVAFGAVLVDCDRRNSFVYLRRRLERDYDLDAGAADCVTGAVAGRPAAEVVRLTYDEPAYDRVIAGCNR